MITARSSFDIKRAMSEYKNLLRRYRGNILFYTAITFLFFTLQYILSLVEYNDRIAIGGSDRWRLLGPAGIFNGLSLGFFIIAVIAMSIVAAVDAFGYIQNRRSVDVYHSLPLTREELFAAHAAAGITQIWLPLAINFIIVAVVSISAPVGGFFPTIVEMLCWMAMTFAIFSITVFAAVSVGTQFDTVLFAIGLNGVLPALYLTVLLLGEAFLYGFVMDDMMELAYKLSPVSLIVGRQLFELTGLNSTESTMYHENCLWIIFWTAAANLIYFIAMNLYRRRPSERAETVGNMGPLQLFLRAAGTFVGGTLLAYIFCALFNMEDSRVIMIGSTAICSMIVYFVGDVLLSRSVRSIAKAFPVAIITALAATLVTASVMFGGFGYESRVPAPEKVSYVELHYYDSRYVYEPTYHYSNNSIVVEEQNAIKAITDAHESQIAQHKIDNDNLSSVNGQLRVTYHMANGSTIKRSYNSIYPDAVKNLAKLETAPGFIEQIHSIYYYVNPGSIENVTAYNAIGDKSVTVKLTGAQKERLVEALRTDLRDQNSAEIENGTKALGYVNIDYKILRSALTARPNAADGPVAVYEATRSDTKEDEYSHRSTEIMVTESFIHTKAFFNSIGEGEVFTNDFSDVEEAYICIPRHYLSHGEAVQQTSREELVGISEQVLKSYYDYELKKYIDSDSWEQPDSFIKVGREDIAKFMNDATSIIRRDGTPYAAIVFTEGEDDAATGYYFVPFDVLDSTVKEKIVTVAKNWYGDAWLERNGFIG